MDVAQALLPAATALLRSPGAGFWRHQRYWAAPTAVYSVCGKVTPPCVMVNGTALPAATCGTSTLS
jgi:hypothetical protein